MKKLIAALSLGLVSSCTIAASAEYTLYRTGIHIPTQKHDESLRIHIATFDALPLKNGEDNAKYNLQTVSLRKSYLLLINRIIAGASIAPSKSSIGVKRGASRNDSEHVKKFCVSSSDLSTFYAYTFFLVRACRASLSFHYRQALSNPALQRIDAQSRVNR